MAEIDQSKNVTDCPPMRTLLMLLSDSIPKAERDALEEHLSHCQDCSALFLREFDSDERWERWDSVLREPTLTEPPTTRREVQGEKSTLDESTTPWRLGGTKTPELPGYQIIREIGRGGMGVVYVARDERLGRNVAIKLLLAGVLAGPERFRRFQNEAVVVARLEHPNIVRIHEVGEVDGAPFLSLEYVEGPTLANSAELSEPSPQEIARLMVTLAKAVQFAHDNGVVHRDLKPSNILLASTAPNMSRPSYSMMVPKVTDFGLAKLVDEEDFTRSGEILGTPSYMAPELFKGTKEQRGAVTVDVYALGAIFYELLTGRPPFRSNSQWETVRKRVESDPPTPRAMDMSIPRDLETICLKCIHRNPDKRYLSAAEFGDDLQRYLDGRPIQARPTSWVERMWKHARRRPGPTLAILSILLCTLAVFGVWAKFTTSLALARNDAITQADSAKANLEQARNAVRHYLEQVRSDQRLGAQGLESLRLSLTEEAIRVYEQIVTEDAGDDLILEYARAHHQLGAIAVESDPDFAAERFRESIRLLSQCIRDGTVLAECYSSTATSLISLAAISKSKGDFDEALALLGEAESVLEGLGQRQTAAEMACWKLAKLNNSQGSVLVELGRTLEAEKKFTKAIRLAEGLPSISDFHLEWSISRGNLGKLLLATDRRVAAEQELRAALKIGRSVVQAARPVLARYRTNVSDQCLALVSLLDSCEWSDGEIAGLYEEAVQQRVRLVRDYPQFADRFLRDVHPIVQSAEQYWVDRGMPDHARRIFEIANQVPPRPDWLIEVRVLLNEGYRELAVHCDNDAARETFASAIALLQSGNAEPSDVDEVSEFQCVAQERLATALWRLGRYEEALTHVENAMDNASEKYVSIPSLHLLHGRILARIGDYERAAASLVHAHDVPNEMQAYHCQALLFCAVAASGDSDLPESDRKKTADSFLRSLQELDANWNAMKVSEMEFGKYPRAIYHATWVEVADRLGDLVGSRPGEIAETHRDAAFELITELCETMHDSEGLRVSLREDSQFASLRGRRLEKILSANIFR